MHDKVLVPKMAMAALLVAIVLVPGLFQALKVALLRTAESISGFPPRSSDQSQFEKSSREPWIAVLGFAFLAVNLLAYFWNR